MYQCNLFYHIIWTLWQMVVSQRKVRIQRTTNVSTFRFIRLIFQMSLREAQGKRTYSDIKSLQTSQRVLILHINMV